MFVVNADKTIECTRGDCGAFTVGAMLNNSAHTFQSGDIIRFMVYGKKDCETVYLRKDVTVSSATQTVQIVLSSADTKFGGIINKATDFWYSVELNPDTAQQTLIGNDKDGAKVFTLYPEGNDEV
jgi:hypothetical protein